MQPSSWSGGRARAFPVRAPPGDEQVDHIQTGERERKKSPYRVIMRTRLTDHPTALPASPNKMGASTVVGRE